MQTKYRKVLMDLQIKGRMRQLKIYSDDTSILNLSSNDYLGIGADSRLQQEFIEKFHQQNAREYAFASSSSRLLTGDTNIAHKLESLIASSYRSEATLLFNSGYHANIGILPPLFGKGDLILSDKLNHASIHDGMRLSYARCKRFNHCDYEQLRSILDKCRNQYKQVVIVTESVFSMDGDVADLSQLVQLKKEFDSLLYIDEAHAVGLYGEQGLGKVEEAGLLEDVDLLIGTFGKAWSSIGAFVCCSQEIKDFLVNASRSLIFTTGLPPITLNWNYFVFAKSLEMSVERCHLQTISRRLRSAFIAADIPTGGITNIVPVYIGDDAVTVQRAEEMREYGYLILPVRPPSVPEKTARFRLSLGADMQWHNLEKLVPLLQTVCEKSS